MITSFHITSDEDQIGMYAGLVTSVFAFAEFSTGILWGRLSDNIGRKPVLMIGLIGTLLSMFVFGFAPSLPIALLARALGGALNGNIGVLQTTVAEIVTAKEHQPSAYAIMPFVWSLGSILGPLIGGALAEPCKNYPGLFSERSVFAKYPFLLPNIVCSTILVAGILIGVLFLEETHQEKKYRRDVGLEAGRKILNFFDRHKGSASFAKLHDANFQESRSLIDDEAPPGYRTTEGSPRYPSSRSLSPAAPPHTISFDQLMPIFLSSKPSKVPPEMPFKFTGGFGMSSKDEGALMVAQGFYAMFAQAVLFPLLAKRYGCLKVLKVAVMLWPMLYFLVPYTVLLPPQYRVLGICFCLLWRTTAQALTLTPNNIMLTNSAPSMLMLGAINGVAGSSASLCRAFGPTVTGYIYSKGLSTGVSGLGWWVTGLVCVMGAVESLLMEETKINSNDPGMIDDEPTIGDHTMINPLSIDAAIVAATRPEERSAEDLSKILIPLRTGDRLAV
ncbi:MAG: hypothetical protein Q9213_002442 [Squamulea squamosa]